MPLARRCWRPCTWWAMCRPPGNRPRPGCNCRWPALPPGCGRCWRTRRSCPRPTPPRRSCSRRCPASSGGPLRTSSSRVQTTSTWARVSRHRHSSATQWPGRWAWTTPACVATTSAWRWRTRCWRRSSPCCAGTVTPRNHSATAPPCKPCCWRVPRPGWRRGRCRAGAATHTLYRRSRCRGHCRRPRARCRRPSAPPSSSPCAPARTAFSRASCCGWTSRRRSISTWPSATTAPGCMRCCSTSTAGAGRAGTTLRSCRSRPTT